MDVQSFVSEFLASEHGAQASQALSAQGLDANSAQSVLAQAAEAAHAQAAEQRWQALTQQSSFPEGSQGVVVLSSRTPLYFDPGFLAESSLGRTKHFSPQTSQPVAREAALTTWLDQVAGLAGLHPKTRFVIFLPTPEFGSGVPMETCRPQWFRPVLPADCRGVSRKGLERFGAYFR